MTDGILNRWQDRLTRGELVDLRPTPGERVSAADGENWGSDRIVDASLLTALLIVPVGNKNWTHRPLRLAGARITAPLVLEAATLTRPLYLTDCFFERQITLNDAQAVTIRLSGCHLPGIDGRALHTRGDLRLEDRCGATGELNLAGAHIGGMLNCDGGNFTNEGGTALNADQLVVDKELSLKRATFAGSVLLRGARIGGQLGCDGARFTNSGGTALNADGVTVDGDMYCGREDPAASEVSPPGFIATGEVSLMGAHIRGQLSCDCGTFTNKDGQALNANGLMVDGDMFCSGEFAAIGEVNLMGAHIGGQLNCDCGTFTNPGAYAVLADGLTVDGDMFCRTQLTDGKVQRFEANGEVRLPGAHVRGQLSCTGGTFTNKDGRALNAPGLIVDGDMFCSREFAAIGEVNLMGAHIGGNLNCDGGSFTNEGKNALKADSLTVDGELFCRTQVLDGRVQRFEANGEVRLPGAHVGGQLNCNGGTFTNPAGDALNADRVTVGGDMFCSHERAANGEVCLPAFAANGEVRLPGARIGGQLNCNGGTFTNPDRMAVRLDRAEVGKEISFRPTRLTGGISLRFAKAGGWCDSEGGWPTKDEIHLLGFNYDAIETDPPVPVKRRLDWLRRDADGFITQPYEQLAGVRRREGNEQQARKVQISAQWRRRRVVNGLADRALWLPRLIWSALLWATIGYGYRPWRIVWPIALLYVFGCWWFTRAKQDGEIIRAQNLDPDIRFNGARYTADLLIPGANLGERVRSIPVGETAWWATVYTLAGWAIAAMLIAGLTGVFKRQ